MNNLDTSEMYVIKRNNKKEIMSFDKISRRIKPFVKNININSSALVIKIIDQLHDNILTTKIDELTAQQCTMLATTNPDYGFLAAQIIISNHHKNTSSNFTEVMNKLYRFKNVKNQNHPLITEELWKISKENQGKINEIIDYEKIF